jgi:hypothetical protein
MRPASLALASAFLSSLMSHCANAEPTRASVSDEILHSYYECSPLPTGRIQVRPFGTEFTTKAVQALKDVGIVEYAIVSTESGVTPSNLMNATQATLDVRIAANAPAAELGVNNGRPCLKTGVQITNIRIVSWDNEIVKIHTIENKQIIFAQGTYDKVFNGLSYQEYLTILDNGLNPNAQPHFKFRSLWVFDPFRNDWTEKMIQFFPIDRDFGGGTIEEILAR